MKKSIYFLLLFICIVTNISNVKADIDYGAFDRAIGSFSNGAGNSEK